MTPTVYEIEYRPGKFITVRTCGGAVGAYHGLTNDRPRKWEDINDNETIVNGHLVRKINLSMRYYD